ncbi:MAG: hypothetical protein PUB69_02980 [Desulfovibrionaceae bacterium]|nr:hypothetical protein [Desulfovibrionaceae bacterium]
MAYSRIWTILVSLSACVFCYCASAYTAPDAEYARLRKSFAKAVASQGQSESEDVESMQGYAKSFFEMARRNPAWGKAPAALYRSGLALEHAAKLSGERFLAVQAVERFDQLVRQYPVQVLADDALFHAASIVLELLGNRSEAEERLKRLCADYPRGDMAPRAMELLNQLLREKEAGQQPPEEQKAEDPQNFAVSGSFSARFRGEVADSAKGEIKQHQEMLTSANTEAALLHVRSRSIGRQLSRIDFQFGTDVTVWRIESLYGDRKRQRPPRLVLTFRNVEPQKDFPVKQLFHDGLLQCVRVDFDAEDETRLIADFSNFSSFSVKKGRKRTPLDCFCFCTTSSFVRRTSNRRKSEL